ncbi:peptidylprolyl isomerase [Fusibacter tunisiensis]|uniref:Peptidyl-prolyl cis-trans isomerase C n=1 Tax=Fusibacter tunisiensis TaxID=1008308 RepID=A0ABS2MS78_9FIRM|nr:peptidylprolyl isomerase [Fusibacter tunisiensis]MBM7562225.1 peptidyl-prolyl cis-trans isomerase C [Fusibacter tunisiensis]
MTSKVLAKVNGREITETDFNNFFASLGQQVQAQFQGEAGMQRLLDELIYQELFYAEALESKVEETEAFQNELELMKESLLKQFNIKQLIESVSVEDSEAEAFYAENPDMFKAQPQVEASHILVDTKEEADKIAKEIGEGLAFTEAAEKYSKCPSSQQGGSLGFFQRGQMVPEFEEAAFKLNLQELSEPVQTQFGYHLIFKTAEKGAETQTLEAVMPQIKQQLLVQKQNQAYLEKVEALKSKYTIEKL